jgi:uncharacterized protein (DUF433 family)
MARRHVHLDQTDDAAKLDLAEAGAASAPSAAARRSSRMWFRQEVRRTREPTVLWTSVMKTLLDRISIDPEVCGGKPCVRGTRIWVSLILDLLADGTTEAELLAEYPQLVHEDVLAAIAYGAEAARERFISVPSDRVA